MRRNNFATGLILCVAFLSSVTLLRNLADWHHYISRHRLSAPISVNQWLLFPRGAYSQIQLESHVHAALDFAATFRTAPLDVTAV